MSKDFRGATRLPWRYKMAIVLRPYICNVISPYLLITNRNSNSYMSFRVVPKSVTFNGVMALISDILPNSVAPGVHCIKIHVRYLIS